MYRECLNNIPYMLSAFPPYKHNLIVWLARPIFCQLTYKTLLGINPFPLQFYVCICKAPNRVRLNSYQTPKIQNSPKRTLDQNNSAHENYTCQHLNGWTHMIIIGSRAKFLWINFQLLLWQNGGKWRGGGRGKAFLNLNTCFSIRNYLLASETYTTTGEGEVA